MPAPQVAGVLQRTGKFKGLGQHGPLAWSMHVDTLVSFPSLYPHLFPLSSLKVSISFGLWHGTFKFFLKWIISCASVRNNSLWSISSKRCFEGSITNHKSLNSVRPPSSLAGRRACVPRHSQFTPGLKSSRKSATRLSPHSRKGETLEIQALHEVLHPEPIGWAFREGAILDTGKTVFLNTSLFCTVLSCQFLALDFSS